MSEGFLEFLLSEGTVSADEVRALGTFHESPADLIGGIAFAHGLLNASQVEQVVHKQQEKNDSFAHLARELSLLTDDQVSTLETLHHLRADLHVLETLILSNVSDLNTASELFGQYLQIRSQTQISNPSHQVAGENSD